MHSSLWAIDSEEVLELETAVSTPDPVTYI